jgi:hypothetical protein
VGLVLQGAHSSLSLYCKRQVDPPPPPRKKVCIYLEVGWYSGNGLDVIIMGPTALVLAVGGGGGGSTYRHVPLVSILGPGEQGAFCPRTHLDLLLEDPRARAAT